MSIPRGFSHLLWPDIDSRSNLQYAPLPFLDFQLFFLLHPSFHMRRFCCGLKVVSYVPEGT